MRLQNRPGASTVQYIGPTVVRVQRHDDILAIVGDIFSQADDDGALDNTCTDDS